METENDIRICATCAYYDKKEMYKNGIKHEVLGKAMCNSPQSPKYKTVVRAKEDCVKYSTEKTEEKKIKITRRHSKTQDKINWIV